MEGKDVRDKGASRRGAAPQGSDAVEFFLQRFRDDLVRLGVDPESLRIFESVVRRDERERAGVRA